MQQTRRGVKNPPPRTALKSSKYRIAPRIFGFVSGAPLIHDKGRDWPGGCRPPVLQIHTKRINDRSASLIEDHRDKCNFSVDNSPGLRQQRTDFGRRTINIELQPACILHWLTRTTVGKEPTGVRLRRGATSRRCIASLMPSSMRLSARAQARTYALMGGLGCRSVLAWIAGLL